MTGGFSYLASAQEGTASEADLKLLEQQRKSNYSPYPGQKFPNRVFLGVAHVHTGYSFDSGMFGITRRPTTSSGLPRAGKSSSTMASAFKQDRPLDWVSITDHAEYMGISDQIRHG